ncbi:putative hydrolase of the HAD superfamily [Bacillus pakistanensis]|uniref:Hydrolase of the HAD superfamily n=1 Tax=Rossellomorea pakistanensis TaxID=992288 RepID=A0ABS2NJJ5_9BACI|nr:HAD family hydrolase [Bacillus pakistanensis]MBM7588032.1 putative hydrolase of the HAD superfamily [Bacillus pakistanensis]
MKAILFDLDRTLHDRDASVQNFLKYQSDWLLRDHPSLDVEAFKERFFVHEKGGYVWKDIVYEKLVEEFSLEVTGEQLLADYVDHFAQHSQEMKGASELLTFLKNQGFKLGMITNGKGAFQDATIDSLKIRDFFDVILISEYEGIKKPDPFLFEKATQVLGLTPKECVYVGDHYENDIVAAKRVGLKTIWLTNKEIAPCFSEAERIIRSLEEWLKELIRAVP